MVQDVVDGKDDSEQHLLDTLSILSCLYMLDCEAGYEKILDGADWKPRHSF